MPKLVVFCGIIGRRRAGMQHPPMAAYPLNHFTAEELAELRRDPVFYLAIGEVATEETLDALEGALHKGAEGATRAVVDVIIARAQAEAERHHDDGVERSVEAAVVADAHAGDGQNGEQQHKTGRQPRRRTKGA